jgi:hypothetical protein
MDAVGHMSALTSALTRASQPSLPDIVLGSLREFVGQCHDYIARGVPCGVDLDAKEWSKGLVLSAFVDHAPWARHPEGAALLKPLFAAYVKAGMIPVALHSAAPVSAKTGLPIHWRPLEQAIIGLSPDTMVALLESGADPREVGDDGDIFAFVRSNQTAKQSIESQALVRETVMRLQIDAARLESAPSARRRMVV